MAFSVLFVHVILSIEHPFLSLVVLIFDPDIIVSSSLRLGYSKKEREKHPIVVSNTDKLIPK